MKKYVIIFAILLLLVNFTLAADEPSAGVSGGDVEAIQNITDDIPLDPETGQFDVGKFNETKTKAEQRIEKINLWLEEKLSWFRFVFGSVPAISWIFFWTIYIWLNFLVFALNGDLVLRMLPERKYNLIASLGIFVALAMLKVYLLCAKLIVKLGGIIWNIFIPLGFVRALIFFIIAIVLVVSGLWFIPSLLIKGFLKSRKAREEQNSKLDREAIHKTAEALRGGS